MHSFIVIGLADTVDMLSADIRSGPTGVICDGQHYPLEDDIKTHVPFINSIPRSAPNNWAHHICRFSSICYYSFVMNVGILTGVGDLIAQHVVEKRPLRNHDWRRSLRQCTYGFLVIVSSHFICYNNGLGAGYLFMVSLFVCQSKMSQLGISDNNTGGIGSAGLYSDLSRRLFFL